MNNKLIWMNGALIFSLCLAYLFFIFYVNSEENNIKYLNENGYTSVEIGNVNRYCPEISLLRRHFTAINPKGEKVKGIVCGKVLGFSDVIDEQPIK